MPIASGNRRALAVATLLNHLLSLWRATTTLVTFLLLPSGFFDQHPAAHFHVECVTEPLTIEPVNTWQICRKGH